jgi:hypothetical protein
MTADVQGSEGKPGDLAVPGPSAPAADVGRAGEGQGGEGQGGEGPVGDGRADVGPVGDGRADVGLVGDGQGGEGRAGDGPGEERTGAAGVETEERPACPGPPPLSLSDADYLAELVTATPSARAAFFSDPIRAIASLLPPPKFWDYGKTMSEKTKRWYWLPWYWYRPLYYRRERQALAMQIFDKVGAKVAGRTLASSINTDSVFEEFFAPIVRASQRSYMSVNFLSWGAFVIGVALIGIGVYVGVDPPKGIDGTIVASVFGGSGAISALGSVYGMSVNGIRQATSDLARVRVVLTSFATQLGQLRALYEGSSTSTRVPTVDGVSQLNKAIEAAMTAALAGMAIADRASTSATGNSSHEAASN